MEIYHTNGSVRDDMSEFLDRYKTFSDLMSDRVKESDRITLFGTYLEEIHR